MNSADTFVRPTAASSPVTSSAGLLRRFMIKALVASVTVLACMGMLEIGLRVTKRYPMGNPEGYFEQGGISYVLKKNVTKQVLWPTMSFRVHTSDLGFRSKRPGSQGLGHRPYYVALGASDVFGNGLDYEKTFVGILSDKMDRHGIDVVNMGVAGHHLMEQSALFKQFVASMTNPPQTVIIFFNPLLIGGYDDNHADVVVRRGDLFDKDSWRIALLRKTLANSSSLYCFFRDSIRRAQQRFIGREEPLDFYIKRFSTQHPIRQPEKTADFLKHLKDLDQAIRSVNARPIFIYCPPAGGFLLNDLKAKGKLDPNLIDTQFFVDVVRNYSEQAGVEFINLEPPVQKRYDKGEKLNFEADGHYNEATSRLVGDHLYDMLRPDRETTRN